MAFTKIVGAGIATDADLEVDDIVAGIVTAEQFVGAASGLTGLPGGIGTALSTDPDSPLNVIYTNDRILTIGATITVDVPDSSAGAYTQYTDIVVDGDADLIVEDGDDFIPDILGLSTSGTAQPLAGGGGRIRADNITNKAGTGAVNFPNGLTATGDVTISGVLTYEDVTNVDAVGLITARNGIEVSGIVTARPGFAVTYYGDGSNLTGIDATSLKDSNDTVRIQANTSGAVVTGILTGDGSGLTNIQPQFDTSLSVSVASTVGQTLTGSAVTSTMESFRIFNNIGTGVSLSDFPVVSPSNLQSYDPFSQRIGLEINVGSSYTSVTGIGSTSWVFDSTKGAGEYLINNNFNQHIQMLTDEGNFIPGGAIYGRIPEREHNPYWDNGYSGVQITSSMGVGVTFSHLVHQTQGLNPAQNKKLLSGNINGKTFITGAEYRENQVEAFGGNGHTLNGYAVITKSKDIFFHQHRAALQWSIDHKTRSGAPSDPGIRIFKKMRAPTTGTYAQIPLSTEDIAAGIVTTHNNNDDKPPTIENVGYPIKVVGGQGNGNNTDYGVLTEKGYVWATAPANNDGFLNQNTTTATLDPVMIWDASSFDCKDLATGEPRFVADLTSRHDSAVSTSPSGQSYVCKVVCPTQNYNEMWCMGGDNTSGQHGDGTTSNKSFGTPMMFDVTYDPDTSRDYTGTFIRSNDLNNFTGTSGTEIAITFEGNDPEFYVGEALRVDFSSGPTDDTYQVHSIISPGVYEIKRWNAKNTRTNQSGSNNAVAFTITGRSQLLRKLNRRIIGTWSGSRNTGFTYVQDSEYTVWYVGENIDGQAGNGLGTTDLKLFVNSSGTVLPKSEIYKFIVHGTQAIFGAIALFSDGTLWLTGHNVSGYGLGATTDVRTWTQIAGPGVAIANAPDGRVVNFWPRMMSSSSNANGALWVVDYKENEGFGHFCSGENGGRQLLNGTTTDSLNWTVPTLWLSDCGTISSPTRTHTGWIMEQQWHMSQTSTSGQTIFCLARNLTTNQYKLVVWGSNSGYLAGTGRQVTTAIGSAGPVEPVFPGDPIKVKNIRGCYHGINYGGLGLMITQDGEMFGIGYITLAGTNNRYRPFWNSAMPVNSSGTINATSAWLGVYTPDVWTQINPNGGY